MSRDDINWQHYRLPSGTVVRFGVDPARHGVRFAVCDDRHWHGFALPINDAVEVLKWLSDQVRPWVPEKLEI